MEIQTIQKILDHLRTADVEFDEPMTKHTTFRIGGNADMFVVPSEMELVPALTACIRNNIPYTVLGHGSNVLVSDLGIRGVTFVLGRPMSNLRMTSAGMVVSAGAPLGFCAQRAWEAGLTGLEFAAGIPGTIGGACVMNAGAYDSEMKDIVESVRVFDPADCRVKTLQASELDFSYRHSIIPEKNYVVIEATLKLAQGNPAEIRAKMDDYAARRKEKQPLNYPSAGSTFKRPEGNYAGKLIMDSNLRGFRIGDAQVSEKHCGFIVNRGHAMCADVLDVIGEVIDRVEECYGVKLEPEVKMIGEFT